MPTVQTIYEVPLLLEEFPPPAAAPEPDPDPEAPEPDPDTDCPTVRFTAATTPSIGAVIVAAASWPLAVLS